MRSTPYASLPSDEQLADAGSRFSVRNRAARVVWQLTWVLLFRPTPRPLFAWRNLLLRMFGAQIGRQVRVMASVRIWAPWNLRMADHSAIGENVDCYSVAPISIGRHALVSQYSFLCTASHDYERAGLPGFDAPITVEDYAWLCADVYVAPGVTIGAGAVVGARSSAFKDIEPWTVNAGTPAKALKPRVLRSRDGSTLISPARAQQDVD
jgi:putative colanic acid biosynthesis acetyltransferase WcaF